ncbi:MAG: EthD family reductase [Acidimicrobiales bacterium]
MTVKLVALWSAPGDVEAFDNDYESTHIPLVAPLPGLKGAVASKALNGPYHRMAELIFDDLDGLNGALGSEAGKRLLADATRLQETHGSKLEVLTVEEQERL